MSMSLQEQDQALRKLRRAYTILICAYTILICAENPAATETVDPARSFSPNDGSLSKHDDDDDNPVRLSWLLNAPYLKALRDLSAAAGALLDRSNTHIPSASDIHPRNPGYAIGACWRLVYGDERNKAGSSPARGGSENAPGIVPHAIVRKRVVVSKATCIPVVEQCAIHQPHANAICIRKRRVFILHDSTSTSSRASSSPTPSGEP